MAIPALPPDIGELYVLGLSQDVTGVSPARLKTKRLTYKLGQSYSPKRRVGAQTLSLDTLVLIKSYTVFNKVQAEKRLFSLLEAWRAPEAKTATGRAKEFFHVSLAEIEKAVRKVQDEQLPHAERFVQQAENLKSSGLLCATFLPNKTLQYILEARVRGVGYCVGEALRHLRGDVALQTYIVKGLRKSGLHYVPTDQVLLFDVSPGSKLEAVFQKTEVSQTWRNSLQAVVGYHLDKGLLGLREWLNITTINPEPALRALGRGLDY